MMSDRHYRRHLSLTETKNQLISGAGTQFDEHVVYAFLSALDSDPELKAKIKAFNDERM